MAREVRELATSAGASARFIWVSPFKIRRVADIVRGKHLDEARRILAFTPNEAARLIEKVLESAVANAEHNFQIPQEELTVASAWADEGPTFKRWQPRARGAAYIIRKRTSHIHVVVERIEAPVSPALPERPRRRRAAPESGATEVAGDEKPTRRGGARRKATAEETEKPAKVRKPRAAKKEEPKAEEKTPRRRAGRKKDATKATSDEAPEEQRRTRRRGGPEKPKGEGGEG